ncbi:phage portal protein [Actinoplanes sp. NPDC051851]|uniref:phage portal protein n=1 Tax=Actinoplanes sp. NPDC051851 TaxID=3154753 RepID=UPI003423F78C
MGWWSEVAARVRDAVAVPRPLTLDLQPLETFAAGDLAPQPVDRLLTAMKNGTGPVTRDQALSVAAVQRGRNELCSIATLPLRLYRGLNVVDSALFRQYDPDVPNVVHMSMTIEDLALERVAWWEVTGQDFDGYPASVRRLDPATVTTIDPKTGKAHPTGKLVWIDRGDGRSWQPHPAALMIRFDSPNPGVLKANSRSIRIAIALDAITEMYASNPALREYFTDADGDVEPMADDEIEPFLADYGAMRQTRPYGWIPGNVKRADVSSPSPRDLTLVELRAEVNLAIANGLGVDPEDLGVSTTSRTYFNGVDRRQEKVNRTYAPFMAAITDRLSMGDVTRRGYAPRFDLADFLKPDPLGQATYWKALKDMGVTDADEIRGWAGLSGPAPKSDPAVAVPAESAGRAGRRFDGGGPAYVFHAADFAGEATAPTVDRQARTITGLAVPYSAVASKYGLKYSFAPGSLEYSDPARMAHLKDHTTPVGFHRSVKDTPAGPVVELAVLDGPEGSPAKAERDQLLYDAEHGLYSGLSIGVDFSIDPADGDVEFDAETGVYTVLRATWRETSTTYMPAFDDARVTKVAASLTGGTMKCPHCGLAHAPGIACATFAAQLRTDPAPAPAVEPPATPQGAATFEQFQAWMTAQQSGAQPAEGPILVNPNPGVAQVNEPQPYRFDRHGNLRAGSHDFSSDLLAGWRSGGGGDQAARDRAESFVREAFERRELGNTAPHEAGQQFAVTPANVVNLNYPTNRTDLYVDQLDYQYPLYAATNKGTLDAVTPFIIPKFSASSGLVADHTTGTEPTPGAFTATAQTITPSAVSGKAEITREAFDQGGNPQMSGLIWKQMVRGWYEALEAYVQAQLVANAASITDITLTTAATDTTLDGLLADAIVPLQYIRGGDRFRTVFTQIDLYKVLVKAKDSTGRRLYPSLGAMNAVGSADPRYGWVEAHGKLWVPAWATAATGSVAASSWMFDPDVVCLWASAPQRIDLQWRVAWVDMGIWGYKAFGITDYTRTRELVYDPV